MVMLGRARDGVVCHVRRRMLMWAEEEGGGLGGLGWRRVGRGDEWVGDGGGWKGEGLGSC